MIGHTGSFLTPNLVSTHDIKLLLTMMVLAFEQSKNMQDRKSRNPTNPWENNVLHTCNVNEISDTIFL